MGDIGTGKTTLAMLVSQGGARRRPLGRDLLGAAPARRDPRHLRRRPGERSYIDFFRRLAAVDLLHLDDLGAEKQTEWVLEQLYSLVNERYEDERGDRRHDQPRCAASSSDQIGERTVSRLIEICGDPLPLFGADRASAYDPLARRPEPRQRASPHSVCSHAGNSS